jgi:hypothetical protein
MTKFPMGGSARAALTLAALVAASLFAIPASAAGPAAVTATGGTTTLKLRGTISTLLNVAGVSVKAVAPATKGSSGLKFPIDGGSIQPTTLRGSVDHLGALRFSHDGDSIVMRKLRMKVTVNGASMSASVAGRRITILRLSLAKAIIASPAATTVQASNITATLSSQGAHVINKEISTSLFTAGLKIGTVSTKITIPAG